MPREQTRSPRSGQGSSGPQTVRDTTPQPGFDLSDLFQPGQEAFFDKSVAESHLATIIAQEIDRERFDNAEYITSKIVKTGPVFDRHHGKGSSTTRSAVGYLRNHGVHHDIDDDDNEKENFLSQPFLQVLAVVCFLSASRDEFDLREGYLNAVRALNTLALLIDKLREENDRETDQVRAIPIRILEMMWDIGIFLVGTVHTRARLLGGNHTALDDANIIHAFHYRKAVNTALDKNRGVGKVCQRALFILTREAVSPFVQPMKLIQSLNGLDLDKFHLDCTQDECKRDTDGTNPPRYHVPSCDQNCGFRTPPTKSILEFDYLLETLGEMPAINVDTTSDKNWWVATTKNTLAISHVWRDGIFGTRDDPGLPNCLHNYFVELAKANDLNSYWIDAATIPKHSKQRKLMIKMINYTFRESRFSLCCDNRVARVTDLEKDNGTALLVIMTAYWHRRAWTLLEGHKATDIRFLREGDMSNPFQVKAAILEVLAYTSTAPMWLLSSIAELEPYMVEGLTPEASGILLSSRKASRPGDSELIWRLLAQPFTSKDVNKALNDTAFDYSETVDAAFISSNASRSDKNGYCWMPGATDAGEWISYAVGARPVEQIQLVTTYLEGQWFRKDATGYFDLINWRSRIVNESVNVDALKEKVKNKLAFQTILACPIWKVGPTKGEWDRVVIMTRPRMAPITSVKDIDREELLWHWETIIELKSGLKFVESDVASLKVGAADDAKRQAALLTASSAGVVLSTAIGLSSGNNADTTPRQRNTNFLNQFWHGSTLHNFAATLACLAAAAMLQNKFGAAAAATPIMAAPSSTGSIKVGFWLDLPDIPDLVEEWSAIIPLAVYLSSPRSDFELAGEVTLRGHLSVSIIPKLWALGGIAKMLRQGDVFFDTASGAGDPLKVYDVQWGSVFPCYNSAAALALTDVVFGGQKKKGPDITQEHLNRWIMENQNELLRRFTLYDTGAGRAPTSDVFCGSSLEGLIQRKRLYGRRQHLKVVVVSSVGVKSKRRRQLFQQLLKSISWHAFELALSFSMSGFLFSCGLIGSGSLLAMGALSRFCAHTIKFERSPLYLRNREVHEGCMLASLHENATSWTFYIGHRGMIDSLLNKPMVEPGKAHPFVLFYLRVAEVLQVLGMTYVAGQKGWDGVIFMILVFTIWLVRGASGNDKHAARWLEEEGFKAVGFTCEFPGRTELLGAVQLLSTEQKTYWMDGILAPVPRREIWLKKIGALNSDAAETEREFYCGLQVDPREVEKYGGP
ncbi:hypothetical protein CHGG_10924 [Chaetomium globosum CBS 148.51]|uniref:Heterokaryon incompatibility domain-containing protein n=1 Tax=Chaetomium globosum (strain ATCC 6205 / CBS 148.51 / DSM 1962 / NBRC 6347 / NRRL 1970) TaxID=306901 RepID=Q2GM80_CHAGB|nr:uncharacterized protein CHGG_10924 [Chaetomium globosum CBS 148.51]EAQ83106.1 hypothetical protein CHGG_10924 [Chaetomium globosum CBS 148.51]